MPQLDVPHHSLTNIRDLTVRRGRRLEAHRERTLYKGKLSGMRATQGACWRRWMDRNPVGAKRMYEVGEVPHTCCDYLLFAH